MNQAQLDNTVKVFQKASSGFVTPGQVLSGLKQAVGGVAGKLVPAGKELAGKAMAGGKELAGKAMAGGIELAGAAGDKLIPSRAFRVAGGLDPLQVRQAKHNIWAAESPVRALGEIERAAQLPGGLFAGRTSVIGKPEAIKRYQAAQDVLTKHYDAQDLADRMRTNYKRLGIGGAVLAGTGGTAYGASKLMGGGAAPAGPATAPEAAAVTETPPATLGASPAVPAAAGSKSGPFESVLGQAQPYLDKARAAMGQAGDFAQANWKPIAGVGGGLLLAKLLHDRLVSKRREKRASEHPLVEGFLKRAVELQLDDHQLQVAVKSAAATNAAFAASWPLAVA